jgi:hypothetical protein
MPKSACQCRLIPIQRIHGLASPFQREDFEKLGCDAVEVLRLRCRKLVAEHERRG